MTNLKVLFTAFCHTLLEEIVITASKYIKTEFIFSNPLDIYFRITAAVPHILDKGLSDKQQNLARVPHHHHHFFQAMAQFCKTEHLLRYAESPQLQSAKMGEEVAQPCIVYAQRKKIIQDASLLSLISTLRESQSCFNSCIIFR